MGGTSTQSIFHSSIHKSSWRGHVFSVAVHGGLLALAFSVVVPAALEVRKSFAHVSLVAPLPVYRSKPIAPPLIAPKMTQHLKTFLPPPVVAPPTPQPKIVEAPQIRETEPPAIAEIKMAPTPVPKEPIQTGVFQAASEVAKASPAPTISIGGFGDSHGIPPTDRPRKDPALLTKVGSFDLPDGGGRGGSSGGAQAGTAIRQTGFGHAGDPGLPKVAANSPGIRTTAFGDAMAAAPPANRNAPEASGLSPVEILFKPKPVYTAEARNLRLEGEVSLQVVFQANGTMRLVRVVRGLGHGLDEAAAEAAMRVRFKPATRGGMPVDTDAMIKITFELT